MAKRSAAILAETFKKPSYQDYVAPQTSFRLNGLVHAKLKAIAEMYPHYSLNDIVNKLLEAALEDFEVGMRGNSFGTEHEGTPEERTHYEGDNEIEKYHKLIDKYGKELVEKLEGTRAKEKKLENTK